MSARILIVEDDQELAFVLREAMLRKEHQAEVVTGIAPLLERIRASSYDVILLDLKLTDGDGLDAIRPCRELAPDIPIIAMTGFGVRQTATEALRRGAYDFFTKPLNMVELEVVVARALERRRLQQQVAALQAAQTAGLEGLVGRSDAFVRVLHAVQRVARTDVSVLIEGESGTGKDLLAQAIHRTSVRKDGPLVAVNCAAIPEGLLESELFGHERGAFTGAIRTRSGRFEAANGGTLFLDEIGDMPLAMQAKILRALEERKIERVGGNRSIDVDVRVIAATNRNLDKLVAAGQFRLDLFYRLQGVRLQIPALRERIEDLPELISTFVERARQHLSRATASISAEALRCLWAYGWPGNIRELQHVIEGALLLSDGTVLPEHLPPQIRRCATEHAAEATADVSRPLDEALGDVERRLILEALRRSNGVQARAAKLLGVSEQSLWYRIKKYKLEPRRSVSAEW